MGGVAFVVRCRAVGSRTSSAYAIPFPELSSDSDFADRHAMKGGRLLRAYHRLPAPLQSMVATVRGLQLRSWRYGPETERLVELALEREAWSSQQWSRYQDERLGYVLDRAARLVPHYREYWKQRGGDARVWTRLSNWPILQKEQVRAAPRSFVAADVDIHSMFEEQTSGTSGTPITVWWSRETSRAWSALFEARIRRWNGVDLHQRWAILGGQLVVPVRRSRPPFWVWNAALHQLYLSSYHLAADSVGAYARALRRYRVVYLFGYASAMANLARLAVETGIAMPRLQVAISNAEPLSERQRMLIAQAFGCPVRDTYGMSELVWGGSECERGGFHCWPEVGIAEVLDDATDEPAPAETTGRLVLTGLLNADMPLIRYQLGDRGAVAASDAACPCGRTLPLIRSIEGRLDDVVVTPDGRSIGRLDPVFKTDLPIREAQVIQEALDDVRVLVVPGPGLMDAHLEAIRSRLHDRLGAGVRVAVEVVPAIPRGPGNKFRGVVSHVTTQPAGGAASAEPGS